jgi:hypothetical protein
MKIKVLSSTTLAIIFGVFICCTISKCISKEPASQKEKGIWNLVIKNETGKDIQDLVVNYKNDQLFFKSFKKDQTSNEKVEIGKDSASFKISWSILKDGKRNSFENALEFHKDGNTTLIIHILPNCTVNFTEIGN